VGLFSPKAASNPRMLRVFQQYGECCVRILDMISLWKAGGETDRDFSWLRKKDDHDEVPWES